MIMVLCDVDGCNNKKIGELKYCHLKSHNKKNKEEYNTYISKIKNEFQIKTFPKDNFIIIDIPRDGACMFICLAKYLINKKNNFIDNINDEDIARKVQDEIVGWIIENKNLEFPGSSGILIKDLICMVHDDMDSIDDYEYIFGIYAGDEIEDDEEFPERWGTILELYAFHNLYKVNVNVYVLKKLNNKFEEIICSKRSNEYRFCLYHNFFNERFENNNEVNLYFNSIHKNAHYELLKKNKK